MNTFGRRVGVELVGNGASVEKMFADTAVAAEESSAVMVRATSTATEAQIAGTAKQIQSLRLKQKEYAAVAVSSIRSAEEQEAAQGNLARVSQRLARITGESTVATSSAAAASAAFSGKTKTAERDFGKTVRGILAGSGAFTGLGRSLAFASGGFLIFASGAALIRKSIDASRLLEVTQRQVGAQLKTSGKSWNEYGARITATDLKLSHIAGFTNQDLLQSFGYLIRVTGNVSTALRLNGVAADVARGRHISLSSASIALSKALGGSVTALRRLGITIPKNVKGMDALNYVAAKFAGQAKAGTTIQQRFSATLVDAEEIIGAALLPTVNRITTEFGNWLAKMNETGRLQKDVNEAVKVAGDVFHLLGGAIHIVDRVTGSFANTLKLLIALKFASLVAGWIGDLQKLSYGWQAVAGSADKAAIAEKGALVSGGAGAAAGAGAAGVAGSAAAGAIAGRAAMSGREAAAARDSINKALGRNVEASVASGLEAGVVAGAATAGTKLSGLKSSLAALTSNPIAIVLALTFVPPSGSGKSFLDKIGLGELGKLPLLGPLDSQIGSLEKKLLDLNNKLPFSPLPHLNTTLPGPVVPDQRFKLGASSLVAGTGEAYQTLIRAGAHLPDIANVTAKQEVAAAKLLNTAAKHSQAIARKIADSIVLLNDARAQLTAGLAQGGPALSSARKSVRTGTIVPPFQPKTLPSPAPGFQLPPPLPLTTHGGPTDFGVKPITKYASFQLTQLENIAQARAALTKGTGDDVAAAKGIIARIKSLIDRGKLSNAALVQALQAEAGALGTIQSAEAAAAQKRQQAAAKALQIASTFSTSVDLQIAQVQAEMTKGTGDDARVLKRIIAEARKALGTKNKQGRLAALQVILQAQQQLAGLTGQSATNYTLPARLQLQLAKAQATGKSITPVLLKMKAALEKALKAAKGNIQKQTDIYNQIYGINQQIGSSVASALGGFKQASTRALTAGLGLTPEQRRALRARLSQLGPHGTVPGKGVGAAGFIIGKDDRPIVIHTKTYLDGREVARNTTKHQQRRRRRNPSQRRGPNAGIGSG